MTKTMTPYPEAASSPDFPQLEQEILSFWNENRIFDASVAARPKNNEYVFYDGPPFANGLPHHGHLLTGFVKDLVARYRTMRGERVERRFGWDCHGLPAEMEAEKELKISGRRAILDYGIERFNDYCRSSVMRYAGEWEWYVNRQARWVDFTNDYKTMDTPYMESVLWAFKTLYDKGLIYEGFKVMPYSWSAETVLSASEIRLDDATREREDKAIEVAFKLKNRLPRLAKRTDADVYVIAWTTTPWTLPSNLALAASKKLTYFANYSEDRNRWEINNRATGKGTDDPAKGVIAIEGKELIDQTYEPLFPYFADTPRAFRILDGSDFIEEGSGTGIVHLAPGFGEDDQRVCTAAGIPTVVPVDGEGRFTDAIYDLPATGQVETERCLLRAPTPDDEHYFITLHTDPQVMATMNDGVMTVEQAKADFAANLEHFKKHGYGQWIVFHKETGAFMGRAGLSFIAQSPEMPAAPTLRCGLLPAFWHGGYGSELCRAALMHGFQHHAMPFIVAGAHGDNPRAHRMLERLGFTLEKEVMFKRVRGPYYRLTRERFDMPESPDANALQLRGLNVIRDTRLTPEDEANHIREKDVEKFGLANMRIIRWLKANGRLIKDEVIKHNYSHCWRTDQPIIYRAMSSWFVDVPKIRDRMVELNQQINWIPGHVKDGRFGKWIENAREWSISRSRFWGCPIPVWRSDNPANKELYVFGSIAEMEAFFFDNANRDDAMMRKKSIIASSHHRIIDLHRPFIDTLTKPDPYDPQYTIRRVEDVFDCWFESGSMPFAQVHYPFANKQWFDTHFPADFIVEYEAQTRGWFYNMFVLAVALFDRIPFKNCICHGVVLDEKGRKLSKRLKNYMDPKALFSQFGSDALRWFMMSSSIMRGSELLLDAEGKFIHDAIRLYIKPIWNAYHFFTLYANADGVKAEFRVQSSEFSLFDRYILAKCREMVERVTAALDAYDTPAATQAISDFVEVLNNWYIRRNKERFWKTERDADKQAAYDTLYTVLHILCRTAAPLLPMVTEAVWQGLHGADSSSIHLADWPDVSAIAREPELIADMDRVRDICNTALSIRNEHKIRVRQPLSKIQIVTNDQNTKHRWATLYGSAIAYIIKDEINVNEVDEGDAGLDDYADYKLKLNNQLLGKRLPEKMKQIIPAAKKGEWEQKPDGLHVAGAVLLPEEYELKLEPKPEIKGAAATSTNDALVVLDLTITPELEAEGKARDLVRMIQQARKDAGLNVSDKIALVVDLPPSAKPALATHKGYIAEQTLALSVAEGDTARSTHRATGEMDGETVSIGLTVAA